MNNSNSFKTLILLLAAVLIFSLAACSTPTDGTEPPDNTEHRIEYLNIDFVTDADKEKWRQPLTALLSKLHVGFYTVELDPEATAPEDRYEMRVGGSYIALILRRLRSYVRRNDRRNFVFGVVLLFQHKQRRP